VLTFSRRRFGQTVPAGGLPGPAERQLSASLARLLVEYEADLDGLLCRNAAQHLPGGCCVTARRTRWSCELRPDQMTNPSSWNAAATRRFVGSSAASSYCPRRRFWINAWPAIITLALRSRLRPRIGRSRAFKRP
jgi:hypothetical protein